MIDYNWHFQDVIRKKIAGRRMEEEIKGKMKKLPVQKVEEVKEVLKEIKRLKKEGKDELNSEMFEKFLEFKQLIK